jgi:hypothetical protein
MIALSLAMVVMVAIMNMRMERDWEYALGTSCISFATVLFNEYMHRNQSSPPTEQ